MNENVIGAIRAWQRRGVLIVNEELLAEIEKGKKSMKKIKIERRILSPVEEIIVDALNELIEKFEKLPVEEIVNPKFKFGEAYWYISRDLEVLDSHITFEAEDPKTLNLNYFRTQAQAQACLDEILEVFKKHQ